MKSHHGKKQKIESLQALRGIAAILVLTYHALHELKDRNIVGYVPSLTIGVDIFFVLSGFIIHYATGEKWKNDNFNEKFTQKRLLRIYPLWISCCLLSLFVIDWFPSAIDTENTIFFSSFFLIPSKMDYLNKNGWTLAYELIFYLMFVVLRPLGTGTMCFIIGAIAYLSGYELLFEFVFGVTLAWAYMNSDMYKYMIAIMLPSFISFIAPYYTRTLREGAISLGLVGLCLYFKKSPKWLTWLGDISYSIYLMHPYVIGGASIAFGFLPVFYGYSVMFVLSVIACTIVVSHFTYNHIEKRFL